MKGWLSLGMLQEMDLTELDVDEMFKLAISSPYSEVLIYL